MQNSHPDRWVPVGLEAQFMPASSHPVVVDGFGLAVWRGENGAIQVWEDRCPHRGMRLSFGFVEGNSLTCLYHGWNYRQNGQCSSIPAHPDLDPPGTICTKSFVTRCHRGTVFANLAPEPVSGFPSVDEAGWMPVRSVYLNVPEKRVREYILAGQGTLGPGFTQTEFDNYESGPDAGDRTAIAIQPIDDNHCAIHVTRSGRDTDIYASLKLARRLVRARREIEAF
ncbi:MAG: Rieske (2Fe-2S) protein [Rhizobiaceae bacterium]|nr:Rieske (2Fe-2S) protein [Rhizobiaceae bacterium]